MEPMTKHGLRTSGKPMSSNESWIDNENEVHSSKIDTLLYVILFDALDGYKIVNISPTAVLRLVHVTPSKVPLKKTFNLPDQNVEIGKYN